MKRKHLTTCVILIITLLLSFCFIEVNAKVDLSLDFSKESSTTSKDISPSELVEIITSNTITIQEKTFLDENFESFKYESSIAPSSINSNLTDDRLDIHASVYSYKDSSNRIITWIPSKVAYNSEEKEFIKNDDVYVASFDNITDTDQVSITYQTTISLPVDKVNNLVNAAYNHVNEYVVNQVYENNMEIYNNQLNLYNKYLADLAKYNLDYSQYLEYLQQKEKYDKYLVEYNKYQEELAVYNNYLTQLDQYNSDLVLYQNYLDELNYYNENYEANRTAYEEYENKMTIINKQLYVMSLIQTKMTHLDRTVYNAVMGNTVTTVLERKSELTQLGVDETTIDRSYNATLNLREIFEQYFSYENDSDKYYYYTSNYFAIKKNMEELLRCLDKLYRSGLTKTALDYFESEEKYIILVAQLALICNGLDDGDVYNYEAWIPKTNKGNLKLNGAKVIDDNWTIDDKTYNQILGTEYLTEDGIQAQPLYTGYPSNVELLTKPTEVSAPTYPKVVNQPVAPTVVTEPSATVTTRPVKLEEVLEPVEYVRPADISSLLEVYNTSLVYRIPFSNNYDLVLKTEFSKKFKNTEEITVEFYNTDKTFISKYTIPNGSYLVYDDIIPKKEKDDIYTYTFIAWEYENHEILDLNCVTKEGFVYPVFKETYNEYEVTWNINGKIYKEMYHYGDIPTCKESLIKENTERMVYFFDSWDKDIVPVTENVTYKAIYRGMTITNSVLTVNSSTNLSELLQSIADQSALSIELVNKDYEITIPTSTLIKMKNDNVENVELDIVEEDNGDYSFSIAANNDKDYSFEVAINLEIDSEHARLYQDDEQIRFSYSSGTLRFNMNSNSTYHIESVYAVNILNNDKIEFSVSGSFAKSGDIITISVDEIEEGIIINKLYYVTKSMEEIKIDSDKFEMPKDDVYIGISYSYIEYIVTFISDGVIIREAKYHYGDMVDTIQAQKKASDDDYSYEFVGWDKTITEVKGDAVYTAVFDSRPLDRPVIEEKVSIIKIIKIAGIIILSGCCIGLFIIITRNKIKKIHKRGK